MGFLLIRCIELRTIAPSLVQIGQGHRAASGRVQPAVPEPVEALAEMPWQAEIFGDPAQVMSGLKARGVAEPSTCKETFLEAALRRVEE